MTGDFDPNVDETGGIGFPLGTFKEIGRRTRFPSHHVLFRQDDSISHLFLVERGLVKLSCIDCKGKPVTILVRGAGALLGLVYLLTGRPMPYSAITLTMAETSRISALRFREELMRNKTALEAILNALAEETAAWTTAVCNFALHPPRVRLLSLLRTLPRLQPGAWEEGGWLCCSLAFPQHELAEMVGVTPEHLSRMLRRLENQGLVRRERKILWVRTTDEPQVLRT